MSLIESMFLISVLTLVLPAGLLMTVSKRIQQHELSDRAAQRLLVSLLVMIIILMTGMYLLHYLGWIRDLMYIVGIPLMMTCTAVACLHICQTPTLHNRRTALMLLGFTGGFALISLAYFQTTEPYTSEASLSIAAACVGAGLIIAGIWQTVHGHNRWLWLGLIALIVALGVYDFVYNGVLATWAGWLLWLLDIVATFVTPVVLIVLAGRVAFYLANNPHPIIWRRWAAGGAAAALLVALLMVNIVDIFLLDGFDDWGPIMLPLFFGALALSTAMLLVWSLKQRHIPVAVGYLLVMAVAIFGFFVLVFSNNTNPQETTVLRAEQVERAVQTYYADHGQYPTSLYDLTPRYLLTLPNPVLYADHEWCYEGGHDFYRLAYVSSPVWRAPADTFGIESVNSAGEPPGEAWMCDALLVKYADKWGVKTR